MEFLAKMCEWIIQGTLVLGGLTVAVYTISVGFVARARRAAEDEFNQQLEDIHRKIKSFAEQLTKNPGADAIDELVAQRTTIENAREETRDSWTPLSLERAVLRPAKLCLFSLLLLAGAYAAVTIAIQTQGILNAAFGALSTLLLAGGLLLSWRAIVRYLLPALRKVDEAARIEAVQPAPKVSCYLQANDTRVDTIRVARNESGQLVLCLETAERQMTSVVIDVCFQPPLEPSRTDRQPLQVRPETDRHMPRWLFFSLNRNVWTPQFFWKQTFGIRCSASGRYEVRVIGQSVSHQDFQRSLHVLVEDIVTAERHDAAAGGLTSQ